MSLKPINILQAAEADLMRRIRNREQAQTGKCEQYAFQREHVRKAKTIKQLLVCSIMDPAPGLKSKKKNTLLIYGDGALLVRALRLLESEYERPVRREETTCTTMTSA
jgi:hypothetical protein